MSATVARKLDAGHEAAASGHLSHARLELFVGTWRTTGRQSDCPFGPAGTIVALETYQWLAGERFMIHRLDGRIDDEPLACVEIIDADPARSACLVHSFYGDGRSNEWSLSEDQQQGAWLVSGTWNVERSIYAVRCTLWVRNGGNTRAAKWEYSEEGAAFRTFWEVTSSKTT